jgi:autotransporter-associated beta strand protein
MDRCISQEMPGTRKTTFMKSRRFPYAFASSIVLFLAAPLHAATYNWNGSATGGATGVSETWDTVTANWTGAGTIWPNSAGDNDAVFSGTAGTVTAITSAPPAIVNDITFNTTGYKIAGGPFFLVPAVTGTTGAVINTATSVSAEISASMGGGLGTSAAAGLTKSGAGRLTLSGINSFSGWVTATGGTLEVTKASAINSIGTSNWIFANNSTFEIDGSAGNIALITRFQVNGGTILNTAGDNTISQGVYMNSSTSNTIRSNGGSLVISGTVNGGTGDRKLTITGTSTSENRLAGVVANSSLVTTVQKTGTGKWIFSGANTYTGATTISEGNLTVFSASGLGKTATADVSVAAGAALNYAAKANSALAIQGALTVTGGTGTTLGGSIGSGPTSASINVTEAATISNAAHTVNIHGIPGVTPATGTYTLISGGAGSSLNPATPPTLGKVYNNTNFTVGSLTSAAASITVGVTAATPLTDAYWSGGFNNEWAASDGTTATSNWTDAPAGLAQPLVPGAAANVIISATTPTSPPTATVLGADMSINSLTIADTVNGLGLGADGSTLTLAASGITMNADVPASSIGSKIALGAGQTWTNDSINTLTVSGNVSGAFPLTKAGTGNLVLSGANSFTGDTRITAGNLALGHVNALASSTLDMNTDDEGTISFVIPGTDTYNLGGLTGTRNINAGGNTLSIGAKNLTTEYSGILSNGALNKVGSGFLTLSGDNTFSGNVTISAGRLILANSGALGVGPKTVFMQGGSRTLFLTNDITLPSNITIVASSNSFDGGGINNESGNNTIQGQINYDSGNPALNISSTDGALTISGNITLITSTRSLYLGGTSVEDNTISGDISTNNPANPLPLVKQGDGKWILSGTNTYNGNTSVNGGELVLANGGSTLLVPKADGSSNKITGNGLGVLTLDGALNIDLANAAGAPDGTSWLLVDVDNVEETFDTNFTVSGFSETALDSKIWETTVGASTYTFTEADGRLVKTAAVAGSPFATWMSTNFPSITAPDNDPDDDPDGDGVSNLGEFALSGHPGDGSNNGLTRFGIENVGGTDHLTYTFACRSGATFSGIGPADASKDGVDYSVRASLDLSGFTLGVDEVSPAITTGLPTVPTGYTYRTFRVTDPQSANPKAFIQVKTSPTAP